MGLRLRQRKRSGSWLLEGQRPVAREVAVEVESADAVLVDLAIAIVVDALADDAVEGPLAVIILAADEQARILGADLAIAVGIGDAHLGDETIAVEILGGVLIGAAVAVVVDGSDRAAQGNPVQQRGIGAVGVELGADVEGAGVEKRGHLRVGTVAIEEIAGEKEGEGAAGQLTRVDVAIDIQRRLLGRRAGLVVGDLDQGQIGAEVALTDGVQFRQLWVLLDPFGQDHVGLGVGVVAVPVDGAIGAHLAAGGRRQEQKQRHHQRRPLDPVCHFDPVADGKEGGFRHLRNLQPI